MHPSQQRVEGGEKRGRVGRGRWGGVSVAVVAVGIAAAAAVGALVDPPSDGAAGGEHERPKMNKNIFPLINNVKILYLELDWLSLLLLLLAAAAAN